jgi:hypothetical protein
MITLPWHPTLATDRAVYHDDTRCLEGAAIEMQYRRPGKGGRPPCEDCASVVAPAKLGWSAMPPEAELSGTHERHCPICRSGKVTPVGHVLAAGGMIKVEHRCAACGIAFFCVRAPLA